jgi:3-hydroxyacyl-CoA dehydrogenase
VSGATTQIVIAGSGKMARDVGMFFIGRGHPVAWLSRSADRLADLERWVRRQLRHLAAPAEPVFFVVGDAGVPRADVFIECINEDEGDKRALLRALEDVVPADAVRVSSSSSIFPGALHDRCAGLHFFYPVELTGFVEAVFPPGFPEEGRRRLRALLADTRLECIEEEGREEAFAVNRLLLPVQAEAMRAVIEGWDPRAVDEATVSPVLPVGQLALMDSIGLDVVGPAVSNFTSTSTSTCRLGEEAAAQYAPLREGLARALALGKRGKKNRDGLLMGAPLPFERTHDGAPAELAARCQCLFVNTCHHALERGLLSEAQLALALEALFGWERGLEAALLPRTGTEAGEVLARAWDETGRLYFVPAEVLRRGRLTPEEVEHRRWPERCPVI